jgi:hypothetical protein
MDFVNDSVPVALLSIGLTHSLFSYRATSLQTAAAALSSLSLSSPPPQVQVFPQSQKQVSTSFTSASMAMEPAASAIPIPASRSASTHADSGSKSLPLDDDASFPSPPNGATGHVYDTGLTKGGKKRGTIFTCESCSKVGGSCWCLCLAID